ncbi:MAG: PEPxxWA-CTERM sorting domain-containing protein [Croceibacterium sp.]
MLTFTGDVFAQAVVLPQGSCPVFHNAVTAGNANGTSSLGNFGYTSDTCVTPAGPVSGIFGINFATDGFSGTLDGPNTAIAGMPGFFSPTFTYTILSGTGRFLGSSGQFLGTGTINAPAQQLNLHFAGTVNAPAVPEPATWAMMLLGFGFVGSAMRSVRRQRTATVSHS